ncbi:MAG: hypothetical protein ACO1Q7_14290 [Gemmatimonas sp.]
MTPLQRQFRVTRLLATIVAAFACVGTLPAQSTPAALDAPRTSTRAWLTLGSGIGGGEGIAGVSGLAQVAVQHKRHALLARISGSSELVWDGAARSYSERGVLYGYAVNNRAGYALAGVGIGAIKRTCEILSVQYGPPPGSDTAVVNYPAVTYRECKQIVSVPIALEGGLHVNSYLRFGLNVFANASSYGLYGGAALTMQLGYFGKRDRQ